MTINITDELFDRTASLHVYICKVEKDGSLTSVRIPMQTVIHAFATNIDGNVEVSPVISDNNLVSFAAGTNHHTFSLLCYGYF